MNSATENYKKIIPAKLLNKAEALLSYLVNYPFQLPKECKHCGSTNFIESAYKKRNDKRNLSFFYCRSCKRRFTQATKTYFAGIVYLELFGNFAKLRLSGYSQETISEILGFSLATARDRDKLFNRIMAEESPNLYAWWKPHQDHIDKKFSPQVKTERDQFIKWLKKLVEHNQVTCPHCYRKVNPHESSITCKHCKSSFEQVVFSDGKTAKKYLIKWVPFNEGLIQGKSGHALAREFGISKRTASYWKQKFTKQMELFHFDKLLQWTEWQHSRGVAYRARQVRNKKSM